ncbi:hypothetical protein DERP_006282 [Dermatophagoides pteronyssinus]|uniref:Uncharacterized protein n=1 Tax=Dermatophagoides pteronyssinus TaxID=6956 RepID=A0ABQ8IXZ6_DERPT|nr:hypothetical protein DERP_006282 [Dermatophagoides pteronyssinus]
MATNNIVITDDEGQTIALILDDNDDEINMDQQQTNKVKLKQCYQFQLNGRKSDRQKKTLWKNVTVKEKKPVTQIVPNDQNQI